MGTPGRKVDMERGRGRGTGPPLFRRRSTIAATATVITTVALTAATAPMSPLDRLELDDDPPGAPLATSAATPRVDDGVAEAATADGDARNADVDVEVALRVPVPVGVDVSLADADAVPEGGMVDGDLDAVVDMDTVMLEDSDEFLEGERVRVTVLVTVLVTDVVGVTDLVVTRARSAGCGAIAACTRPSTGFARARWTRETHRRPARRAAARWRQRGIGGA